MPGPLGTLGPTVDPNWAWDTYGWTNQGNLGGDVQGQNLGAAPGQIATALGTPSALSGYISRSMDPDDSTQSSGTLTFVTGTAQLFGLLVLEPVSTTGIVVGGKTAGPPTHSVAGLYNAVTGAQVAHTADLLTAGFGTAAAKIAWSAVTPIAPGFYWALLVESSGTMGTVNAMSLATNTEMQVLLTGTAAIPFTPGSTPRFATGGTGLTSLTATPAGIPAALTTSMVISATATASFVGIY